MDADETAVRRTTILQVTRPPHHLWRFHWHELIPLGRSVRGEVYLSALEPCGDRARVRDRLRGLLRRVSIVEERLAVVDGYLVQVLEDRVALLSRDVDAELDRLLRWLRESETPVRANAGRSA